MRINRVLLPAIVLAALLCACLPVCAQTTATVDVRPLMDPHISALVLIDGKLVTVETMEMAPRGQQVMVWLRELEKLGWGTVLGGDSPEKTVFKTKGVSLTFIKGQSVAMVNSLAVQLPIDTYLRDGRLMVPLSFVAKSLGYTYDLSMKPVASIATTPAAKTNSIHGGVLYNGKGVEGVRVSLVDPEYNTVKGFQAVTDSEGHYTFERVPEGRYMAYVWVGHNPDYFNRVSEEVTAAGGKMATVQPINLGRILRPVRPRIDEAAVSANGKIVLEWSPCEGAAGYSIVITKFATQDKIASAQSARPKVEMPAKSFVPGTQYAADIEARDSEGRLLGGTVGVGGKTWTFTVKEAEKPADKPAADVVAKPATKPTVKVVPTPAPKTPSKPIVTVQPKP